MSLFTLQDFPRHDGTPCLIFSETETGPVLRRVSVKDSPGAQVLSNDAFKRQLSMHDVSGDGELDDTDVSDNADPEFTSKLERLIAMRLRHYEKERLIQKGRQERRKAEARERELKLRRHEMELDVEEIEASFTPRSVSRKNFNAENNFATEPARRVSHHRVTLSDSNYFAAVDEATTKPDPNPQRSTIELGTINGGPSLRHDSEDIPPPPRYNGYHARNLSDTSPRKLAVSSHTRYPSENSPGKLTVEPHPLAAQPMKHRRSHRRSFSHGTQETEEKKIEHSGHQRNDSSAEDVMTFGIAAYAGFV